MEYIKQAGDDLETFRGDSLTVNLDDWSGSFIGGATDRSKKDEQTTYSFAGEIISRSDEGVTVMADAVISNATKKNAYWSINAKRLWLLPGSEWAISNAVLKVGEVPLLYIPFFYLPGDELIFHPVLGYRSREGSFFQTTSYLLGRPKAKSSSESSIMRMFGENSNIERRREGLFLRSTGKRLRSEDEVSLSLLFDAYSNLGSYLGVNASLPKNDWLNKIDISAGLGFSRNIYFVIDDYYSPFAQFDGSSDWNSSLFFTQKLPFRYRFKVDGSLAAAGATLSWSIPYYADPYIDQDFLNRSEDMDWFNLVKQGIAVEDTDNSIGVLGSYEWRLNATYNPKLDFFTPYIQTLSLSSASTALSFRSKASSLYASSVAPNRTFFYPDRFTLFSISASIAGTPLSLGSKQTSPVPTQSSVSTNNSEAFNNPMDADKKVLIDMARSPWDREEDDKNAKDKPEGGSGAKTAEEKVLSPPPLNQRFQRSTASGALLRFGYTANPSSSSELQFRSNPWKEADEVDWNEISSILSASKLDGTLSAKYSSPMDYLTADLRLLGTGVFQNYTYINDESEEFDTPAERDAAALRAYRSTYYSTSAEFLLGLKPFKENPAWSATNAQYALRGLLVKSIFDGTALDPNWSEQRGKWRAEDIDTHKVSLNLVALAYDLPQTLSVSTDLPPEESTMSANTVIRIWKSTTSASGKAIKPFSDIRFEPLVVSEFIDFEKKRSIKQDLVYDPELDEITSVGTNLGYGPLSLAFSAIYTRPYKLIPGVGWQLENVEERLLPKNFSISYADSFKSEMLWRRRLSYSFDIASSLALDLQRYTQSFFNFSLGTTFKIAEFMDISVSVRSQNSVIFRYLQDIPYFSLPVPLPGEKDPLVDLFNSFRFDDDTLRKNSGFKLKAFNLKAIHYLGDWNASLGVDMTPYLDQSSRPYSYKINSEISFLVQWLPIQEFKTEIKKDKAGFVFK
ncbi:LPS-assembly protein LptD [Treponema sp.]